MAYLTKEERAAKKEKDRKQREEGQKKIGSWLEKAGKGATGFVRGMPSKLKSISDKQKAKSKADKEKRKAKREKEAKAHSAKMADRKKATKARVAAADAKAKAAKAAREAKKTTKAKTAKTTGSCQNPYTGQVSLPAFRQGDVVSLHRGSSSHHHGGSFRESSTGGVEKVDYQHAASSYQVGIRQSHATRMVFGTVSR